MRIDTIFVVACGLLLCPINSWAAFPPIVLEPISQGELVSPVGITNAQDGSNRLFITEQRGQIRVLENGTLLESPFLDLSSRLVPERASFDERGLLGLAFHPNFGSPDALHHDKFYVYYSAPHPDADPNDPINPVDHQSVIAEYSVSNLGSNTAELASERILLTIDQPQFNHNAGYLGFGPDGMLYIATGDGGGGGDNEPGHTGGGPDNPSGGLGNAQDRTKLLGKILRIDPHASDGPTGEYGIPNDNPFVGEAGVQEEIYAYGLRNPWRAAFDNGPGGTQRLFVADVGQSTVEEINIVQSAGNYGWRIQEGTFDFDPTISPEPPVPLIDPIAQYTRPGADNGLPEIGVSVTGGVVHRGADPLLNGKYIFGDWSTGFRPPSGTLLGLEETMPDDFELSVLDVAGGNPLDAYILAFGIDETGEVYVATKQTLGPSELNDLGLPTGAIYRIQSVPEPTNALCYSLLLFGLCRNRRRPHTVQKLTRRNTRAK